MSRRDGQRLKRGNPSRLGPWNPRALSGLAAWYRADLGITIATGVSAWADQSGTGDPNKNAVQATGTRQPAYNASNASFAGRPTLTFTAANGQNLFSANWAATVAQPISAIVVGSTPHPATNIIALDLNTTELSLDSASTGAPQGYAGTIVNATAGDFANPTIFGCVFNGASGAWYVSQKTGTTVNFGANGPITATCIGGLYSAPANSTNNWNGPIAEVIVYSRALSAAEMGQLMLYAGARYGITIGA